MAGTRTRSKTPYTRYISGFRKTTRYKAEFEVCTKKIDTVNTTFSPELESQITQTMTDVVVEDFHKRRAAGEIFNNPMSMTLSYFDAILTSGTVHNIVPSQCSKIDFMVNYIRERGIAYIAPPTGMAKSIDSLIKTASSQSVANVTSEEINILATIGEIGETKEMLVTTLRRLWRIGDTMRKFASLIRYGTAKPGKKPLSKKERIKNYYLFLENFWMEMRMGWRPFYYECQALHDACIALRKFPPRQTFRGKTTAEFRNEDVVTSDQFLRVCNFKRTYYNKVTIRAGTLAQQRADGFPDTFGLTKLPQAIWELTKLSWAVDYFFNVGTVIAAYTPDTLWEPLCSWYVVHQRIEKTIEMTGTYQKDGSFQPTVKGGLYNLVEIKKDRVPCAYLGVTLRPKLNLAKYLDLLAVTRQHFSKTYRMLERNVPKKAKRKSYA